MSGQESAGNGGSFGFALDDLAVADFYRKLVGGLAAIGIEVSIDPRPFDLDDEQPLDRNFFHCTCDPEYVRRYWQKLVWVSGVFEAFAGRFNGTYILSTPLDVSRPVATYATFSGEP